MHPNEERPNVNLTTNLKHLRALAGRSQEETALALGVNRSSYSGYEVGSAEPNASVLCVMAKYHCVSLDMLLLEDLRKWTRFALQKEQRKRAPEQPVLPAVAVPTATKPVEEPKNQPEMVTKKLIQERHPRNMNNRLERNVPKTAPGEQRRSPRKVAAPAEKDTVLLQLDAKTQVRVKTGYALRQWMENYPKAVVVAGKMAGR